MHGVLGTTSGTGAAFLCPRWIEFAERVDVKLEFVIVKVHTQLDSPPKRLDEPA
jgi:hypothetical protein